MRMDSITKTIWKPDKQEAPSVSGIAECYSESCPAS